MPRAVVKRDVEGFDIVDHLAAQQAVHAATIVANHAAKRAAGVGGGIGGVGEVMNFRCIAEAVEHDSRLNTGEPGLRVNGRERVHVAGVVEDHGYVDALAGRAGSGSARQNGCAGGAAGSKRGFHIRSIARIDHADGELTIVRRVGCVKGAGTGIETDFTAKIMPEKSFELAVSGEALMGQWAFKDRKGRITHPKMVTRLTKRVRKQVSATATLPQRCRGR